LNKILIFAGASEANLLIQKLSNDYMNLAEFHIIYEDEKIEKIKKEDLYFYKMSFFAFSQYKNLILMKDFNKIVVLIKNRVEAEYVLNKIKHYKIPILFVKFWQDFEVPNQNNIEVIDVPVLVVNKIIDFLPGVPLYARDIGLGIGEILEVEIPIHSPFAYKNVSIFNRYNVKAVAIYRNNELKMVDEKTIILPNDKIVLIGDPKALKDLFNQIKSNVGSFPEPYGKNIYLLIDMKNMDKKTISKLLKSALYLHRRLKNKKLIIKIINPSITSRLYKLFKFPNIEIIRDYFTTSFKEALKEDIKSLNIGVIVTNNDTFYKYDELFIKSKKPVIKIGEVSIKKCVSLNVILNDKYITKIAPVIFDLSYQLDKEIKFFNIDPENKYPEIIEYLQTLAKSFRFAKVKFITKNANPVFLLRQEINSCLVEALVTKPVSLIRQILFPKIENSYLMLNELNQILIPLKDEDESAS